MGLSLNVDPKRVGILGVSSGGRQAMLTAMRPNDYADAGPAGVDASVQCAVMCWPVIDPLGRYEYAQNLKGGEHDKHAQNWISAHDRYWGSTEMILRAPHSREALEVHGRTTIEVDAVLESSSREENFHKR
jgi:poly(3-hydroxybutyrate) depolymerase